MVQSVDNVTKYDALKKFSLCLCIASIFMTVPSVAEQIPVNSPSDSMASDVTLVTKTTDATLPEKKTPSPDAEPSAPASPADKIVSDVLGDAMSATQTPLEHSDKPSLMQEGIKTIGLLTVLLVVFWWFSNWLKKSGRLARLAGTGSDIQCVSVFSVGQKEKIALLKVRDQELLVGITQTNIQTLHHFGDGQTEKDAPSAMEFSTILDKTDTKSQTTV